MRSYARRMTTSATSGTGPTANAMRRALKRARDGVALDVTEAAVLLQARGADLDDLTASAARVRDAGLEAAGRPGVITYSKSVFIPLTRLCRDKCHYCTFVTVPGKLRRAGHGMFMSPDEVLDIARKGAELGCKEALITLGDKPEDRWPRPANGSTRTATTTRSRTYGPSRSGSWRRRACCPTSTRVSCHGPTSSGSSPSRRAWA